MQKWEYEFVMTDFVATDAATLNEYGEDGWELVNVVVLGDVTYYYFKRPKEETNEPQTETVQWS